MKDIHIRNDRRNTLEIMLDDIEPLNCLRVVAKIDGSMSSWAVNRKTARELADAIYEILNERRR